MKNKKRSRQTDEFHGLLINFTFFILIASLVFACCSFLPALSKPLLGPHSFRQTQNAISSYYSVKLNAPIWQNIMPVCGPPWNLPTEFPLYQYLAGKLHQVFAIPLDVSGRILSIMFFFTAVLFAFLILKQLDLSLPQSFLSVSVVVSSPLYLFWGSAYLMETTALFLALAYILFSIKFIDGFLINKPKSLFSQDRLTSLVWISLALVSGILCALQKGTTWVSAAGVLILIALWRMRKQIGRHLFKISMTLGSLIIFPLGAASKWIAYGDSLKMKNPFARQLFVVSSPNHNRWNYGTLDQKLDPATWGHIFRHVTDQLLVPTPVIGSLFIVAILIFGSLCSPKRIPIILILLAGFLSGPIVFTNLYFEHSYYWCANGVWLLLAVGIAISGVWESELGKNWPRFVALLATMAIVFSGFSVWYLNFRPVFEALPTYKQLSKAWIQPVQDIVPKQRTLLVIGNGWNPNSLYYAERKGIAFPDSVIIGNRALTPGLLRFSIPGLELEESIKNLNSDEQLGAVVFAENLIKSDNQQEVVDILMRFGMALEGIRTPFGILFPAIDLTKK